MKKPQRKSSIHPSVVLKYSLPMLKHPWIWTRLAKLQGEKWLFDFLYPNANGGKARKIRQASFRITDRCNLRCRTCGQWGENGFLLSENLAQLKKEEVSPGRYCEVFSDLVSNDHRPLVYFWGGEPMLYKGLLDLIERSSSLKLPTSIATNGTGLASAAKRLIDAPLFLCQVSIDGDTRELHDHLRPPSAGRKSNFDDIREGLEKLNSLRIRRHKTLPIIASLTVISKENLHRLTAIYKAFRKQVDFFVFYLSWWISPGRAQAHEADFNGRFGFVPTRHRGWIGGWKPDDYRLLNNQIQTLLNHSNRWGEPPVTLIPNVALTEDNLKRYYTDHRFRFGFNKCVSIYQAIEINSNGDVSPCRDYHDYVVGNIKNENIHDLWHSKAYVRFRKSIAEQGLMPVCSRCCGLMGY